MDESGTSNSPVMNVDDGSSNAGDDDSCSMRVGDAFAFNFGILRVRSGRKEGEIRTKFVTRQLFSVDGRGGGGGELTHEQSSRPNWVDLTFGQARSGGGFKSFTTATAVTAVAVASEEEPAGAAVVKLAKAEVNKVFRYELDDEKWNPNYMLPEHVEDLKTIRSSDMHLMEIVEAVDKLQERLKIVTGDDAMSMEAQKNATLFFSILLRSTFTSKRVLNEYMLTREAFDLLHRDMAREAMRKLLVLLMNGENADSLPLLKKATTP
ncbi:hypothetical protein RJ640_003877 [Escallonia rubra]|uniref:RNA polymerase Rpb1 domain-containing protein n=1 Tax=Escallonia rubra TaxID=112253 RepID=A0AA88U8D3_9ASTE|nr:hypothetical protein RJ640_003877 [Escallonia rubra]